MNNKVFFGLLILAAGALVGWFVFGGAVYPPGGPTGIDREEPFSPNGATEAFPDLMQASGADQMEDKGGVAARTVVTYTDTGFAPKTAAVKTGSTVTFVNESSGGMWVASDVHPTHQLLPGFDQKSSVASGGTYEYTFTRIGTWTYHNHQNPTDQATVVVTQ